MIVNGKHLLTLRSECVKLYKPIIVQAHVVSGALVVAYLVAYLLDIAIGDVLW